MVVSDCDARRLWYAQVAACYTACVCEVQGVVLAASLTATAASQGGSAAVELRMKAVKAAPYSLAAYRQILQEIKTALKVVFLSFFKARLQYCSDLLSALKGEAFHYL